MNMNGKQELDSDAAAAAAIAAAKMKASEPYSEAHEFALLAWLDATLRQADGSPRLTPLMLQYGDLNDRKLASKALANGQILQTALRVLAPEPDRLQKFFNSWNRKAKVRLFFKFLFVCQGPGKG